MQERLVPAMMAPARTIKNTRLLLKAAEKTGVPALLSEQYPQGLGATIPEIQKAAGAAEILPKMHFSCMEDPGFAKAFNSLDRRQAVLTGMEAHICVLQTAIDLLDMDYTVHLPWDAVCSRIDGNRDAAMKFMERAGAIITSSETVAFQILEKAGTSEFKEISSLLK